MKLEPVQGDLLPKQERNKHHCRCHLFRESRCHFACVNGSTWNRESTTKTLLKSRRRKRSSWIQNFGTDVFLKIRVFSSFVNSNMAELFAKRRWSQEEISVLLRSLLKTSRNSRTFWRKSNSSSIARQRVVTERLRRVHLPRWKFPRHALHHPIRIDSGWKKEIKKGRQTVFFTAVNPMQHIYTRKGTTTWRSPELQCTNEIGKYTRPQYTGSIWGLLRRRRDWRSIKRDPARSFSRHSTSSVCWEGGGTEFRRRIIQQSPWIFSFTAKNCTETGLARRTNGYYKHWKERERERASHVHSSKYGKTCLGEIDCRIQGLPHSTVEQEDHTREEVVEKLIHQFETHPSRGALKADLRQNHAYNPFSEKSKDMIHSMVNVKYFDLLKFSLLLVWHIGRKALYIVFAKLACVLQTKRANWTGIDLMHYRFHNTW